MTRHMTSLSCLNIDTWHVITCRRRANQYSHRLEVLDFTGFYPARSEGNVEKAAQPSNLGSALGSTARGHDNIRNSRPMYSIV